MRCCCAARQLGVDEALTPQTPLPNPAVGFLFFDEMNESRAATTDNET
jgi:hypothetical protein